MIFWILNCLLVFAICMLCAGILIPQILLIAFRRNLFDEVDERKIHHGTVPRLGGIAFVPVIFFSTILLCGIHIAMGNESFIDLFASNARALCFGFCSILVLYLVGIADDLIGIRYSAKFVAQILCSVMLIAGGLTINNLHGILGIYILPDWISWLLTVLFVVFIINAINLIDGVDGLASGLSSVALLFYGYFFVLEERYIFAMLSFAAIGVLLPFFYYNVFGRAERRRKIFMGDTGSLTIGFLLCFLGIRLITCIPDDEGLPNPLLIMLLAAGYSESRRVAGLHPPQAASQESVHARQEPYSPQVAGGRHGAARRHAGDRLRHRGADLPEYLHFAVHRSDDSGADRHRVVDGFQHLADEPHQAQRVGSGEKLDE